MNTPGPQLTDLEARVITVVLRMVLEDPEYYKEDMFDGHEWAALRRALAKLKAAP